MADENRSDPKQLTKLKQLKLNEISKSLWINLSRENFSSLIEDVVDSLVIEDYKTTVNNRRYDLKNAEKFLLEIISRKFSQNEALELHNKDKRNNILNILSNLESILSKI